MLNEEKIKQYASEWAFDMEIQALKSDGITNVDVINQSIEMILATPLTSRLFNLAFGSNFSLRIFDNMDVDYLQEVLNDTLEAIKRWEDRIIIIEDSVRLNANADKNTITLTIPYIIKEREILGVFSKVIRK